MRALLGGRVVQDDESSASDVPDPATKARTAPQAGPSRASKWGGEAITISQKSTYILVLL